LEWEECEVWIEIPCEGENMDKLFKVEKLLREIGVSFDTGYDLVEHRRDWMFDYSLKGAKVRLKPKKEE